MQHRLGTGELSTILLAKEQSTNLATIGERKARHLAKKDGIAFVGTFGILEETFRQKLVKDLRKAYQKLLATGTYIDLRLLNRSLEQFDLPSL